MSKIKIIAELAQGYEGKIELAKQLIHSAKLAGAHYAKIQVVYADELSTKDYENFKLFKSLELNKNQWKEIFNFARKKKIELISEVFGAKSINVCKFAKSKYYKIHPTDLTNYNLLKLIKSIKPKKIFVGIGGAKQKEIEKVLNFFKNYEVILLHGHQSLPTPNEDINIGRIQNILKNYKSKHKKMSIGIADHVLPFDKQHNLIIGMAIAAGASYVEKHLTTNRVYKLEDYHSALNPDEFKKMTVDISKIAKIHGNGAYLSSNSEKKYRNATRRSIFASKVIKKNTILNESHLVMKRSRKISDIQEQNKLIGKKTKRMIKKNQIILKRDFS